MRPALTLGAVAALLASCQGETAPAPPERRTAAGGVLGGAVSDEMLPLDTVRSTAPPATGEAGTDDDGDADAAEGTAQSRRRAPSPARGEGRASGSPADPGPAASPAPAATQADD